VPVWIDDRDSTRLRYRAYRRWPRCMHNLGYLPTRVREHSVRWEGGPPRRWRGPRPRPSLCAVGSVASVSVHCGV
jgi:hypothetical protein